MDMEMLSILMGYYIADIDVQNNGGVFLLTLVEAVRKIVTSFIEYMR